MTDFRALVKTKVEDLGVKEAAKFFGVSIAAVSNWATGKNDPPLRAVELVLSELGEEVVQTPLVPQPLVDWDGKNVVLLVPVYRTFNPDTHFTLFANYAKYGPEKLGMDQVKRTNVYEARNILVDRFLKHTKAEWAIMSDDDMIFPTGNPTLFNVRYKAGVSNEIASRVALSRIMSHPKERGIVGTLYFGRHEAGRAQCASGFSDPNSNDKFRKGGYGDGLKQEDWVGTGFMRIHRSVFERMRDEIDNGRWGDDLKPLSEKSNWHGFFTPLKVGVGEDVSFCTRAKEIGIPSFVDCGLVCLHAGDCLYGPRNTKG